MSDTPRTATIDRATKETQIHLELNLDGSGQADISTGIPFLDHMLDLFTKHGLFDLTIQARGDLEIDIHHTNEDVGLCLGEAFAQALGDKQGIRRFGNAFVPMEEALARVVLDISGRPLFVGFAGEGEPPAILATGGHMDQGREAYSIGDAKSILNAVVIKAGINMNVAILSGEDLHHTLEAVFKALGRAMDAATSLDARVSGVPSTKGIL